MFQEYVENPITKGAHNVIHERFYQFNRAKKRMFRNGQMDRQEFTVFAPLKRRSDGQLADVRSE